jgi:hypothetical protein
MPNPHVLSGANSSLTTFIPWFGTMQYVGE